MAVYLTCTKGRSQLKKHIEVCRKCHENLTCETFQEFCEKDVDVAAAPAGVIDKPAVTEALNHVVHQLMEIELLLGYPSEKKRNIVIGTEKDPLPKKVMIEKIKQALKEIRTHC